MQDFYIFTNFDSNIKIIPQIFLTLTIVVSTKYIILSNISWALHQYFQKKDGKTKLLEPQGSISKKVPYLLYDMNGYT